MAYPSNSEPTAETLLPSVYSRWLALEERKAEVGEDLKELFAELKAEGFNPKAAREAFRYFRHMAEPDVVNHTADVDLYVLALMRATRAYACEDDGADVLGGFIEQGGEYDIPDHDPETGEITEPATHAADAPEAEPLTDPVPVSGATQSTAALTEVHGGGDVRDSTERSVVRIGHDQAKADPTTDMGIAGTQARPVDTHTPPGAPAGEVAAPAVASPALDLRTDIQRTMDEVQAKRDISKVVFFHEDADPRCLDPMTCGSHSRLAVCPRCRRAAGEDVPDEAAA